MALSIHSSFCCLLAFRAIYIMEQNVPICGDYEKEATRSATIINRR